MFQHVTFLTSVAKPSQFPSDEGIEIAFAGRSNAGKSSAINTITSNKNLAKTSKMPGRTQLINYFTLSENTYLVDLPGYGYAKVPSTIKAQIERLLGNYLINRQCLKGLILLMDIRHPVTSVDKELLEIAAHRNLPVHVLLTKCDKLNRGPAHVILLKVKNQLKHLSPLFTVQLFSSLHKVGVEEVQECINGWCGFTDESEKQDLS